MHCEWCVCVRLCRSFLIFTCPRSLSLPLSFSLPLSSFFFCRAAPRTLQIKITKKCSVVAVLLIPLYMCALARIAHVDRWRTEITNTFQAATATTAKCLEKWLVVTRSSVHFFRRLAVARKKKKKETRCAIEPMLEWVEAPQSKAHGEKIANSRRTSGIEPNSRNLFESKICHFSCERHDDDEDMPACSGLFWCLAGRLAQPIPTSIWRRAMADLPMYF